MRSATDANLYAEELRNSWKSISKIERDLLECERTIVRMDLH